MDGTETSPAPAATDGGTPESLLTKGVTPGQDQETPGPAGQDRTTAQTGQAGADQPREDHAPEKPEDYGLKFAEGVEVDQAALGDFQKAAHEMGLTQNQAQKLADLYAAKMAGGTEMFQKAQMDAVMAAERDWVKTIQGRPTYREDLGHAQRALAEYGSPELFEIMNHTRIGSHPTMFDFMAKVGRELAEPKMRGAAWAAKEQPLYQRMWPDDK